MRTALRSLIRTYMNTAANGLFVSASLVDAGRSRRVIDWYRQSVIVCPPSTCSGTAAAITLLYHDDTKSRPGCLCLSVCLCGRFSPCRRRTIDQTARPTVIHVAYARIRFKATRRSNKSLRPERRKRYAHDAISVRRRQTNKLTNRKTSPSSRKLAALRRRLSPLDTKGNYSTTSNNTKLVHWPLMGGLLPLVQRGGGFAGYRGGIKFAVCVFRTHLLRNCSTDLAEILHRDGGLSRTLLFAFWWGLPPPPSGGEPKM